MVELFLQRHTELLTQGLEHVEVLLVLAVVIRLGLDALKDAHSERKVVHAASRLQSALDNLGRGHEVLRKRVVEATLRLKLVLDTLKELDIAVVELLVRLVVSRVRTR